MKYYVTLHGQELEVELFRCSDGNLRARLGDREYDVDLSEIEGARRYSVLLDRRSFDVVVDAQATKLHLQVSGHGLDVLVEDDRQRAARRISESAPAGPVTIYSAMPGIVRGVLVEPGQAVEEGQALVILEAMKMENEIPAEQSGVVREVLITPESVVEGGAPLVVLDPPPAQ